MATSQTYGNEWIDYTQRYYAFNVYPENLQLYFGDDDGILDLNVYKIDYNTLVNSGIPLGTFTTENIQIFGREKEIPLHIEDGGDSAMDPGDYILFCAERNDGWLDSTLYADPDGIGNPFYSLYNDTIDYFFTWNTSTNNLRFTVETDVDFASYTPADYVWYKRWQGNTGQYQEGERLSQSSSSFFTSGEGWSSNKTNGAAGHTWNSTLQLYDIYQGAGAPDVQLLGMQVGISNAAFTGTGNHHVEWTIGLSDYVMVDSIWTGYKGIRVQATVPNAIIPAAQPANVKINIVPDQGAVTDYQSISFWSFKYPRMPSFNNEDRIEFNLENNPIESKIRLDLSNITYDVPVAFVLGDTPRMIPVVPNGGSFSALIPNSSNGAEQRFIYQDTSTIHLVTSMSPVGINNDGLFTDFTAQDLESALLMVSHPSLDAASDAYQAHRESAFGGNYNVVRADVNELYQQFGGGIEKHISGIRRFSHFVYNQSTLKPVGLFLMGKGIKEATIGTDAGTRRNLTYNNESLIPSFGQPSSDVCITAGLEGTLSWTPLIATGRISARTNTELQDYLDKIIQFETEQNPLDIYDTPNKDWQKQIIHFAGGSDAGQQVQFQGYMNGMETTASDSLFGANVMRVYKDDNDPLNPAILQSVTDRIQEGVSLMSYFGHASATGSGFEINLDEPINWNNAGKYPLMLVNSCYNGNIFQYTNSKSEEFVQVPNAGAIGYIASTNVGYASQLNWYSQSFYREFGYRSYGEPLGEQMKRNIQVLEPVAPNTLYYETTCTQMVLNGDPMLRINHHDRPEIELLEENVWFTPENLDLTMDSIEMHINLKNIGRSVVDTFSIEIIRDFPGTSVDSTYFFTLPNLHYQTEFTFKMPMQANIGLGLNAFEISVDLPTEIDEQYDEIGNNQIVKTLYIDVDGIIPVIPYEFAVVPIDSVTVKASTNNPIADFNTYRFEIDTIDFEGAPSPAHRFAIVSGYGGVKEVNPSEWTLTGNPSADGTLVCEDSVVYFWRVSIDGDTLWRESSFEHIINREGWGQDHFFQFKKNNFSGIEYDRPNRHRNFIQDDKPLECHVYNSTANSQNNAYYINGNQQDYGVCEYTPSFYVAVIDPITHEPWGTRWTATNENMGNDFGNRNDNTGCRQRVENYFIFNQNNGGYITAFQNMIAAVPDSHYILIYTPMYADYSAWDAIDPGLYTMFSGLGSDSIYAGRPELPFAFFCKKGDPNSVVEYCAVDASDDFILQATLEGYDNVGVETTPLIGPTTNWGNVYWKQDPLEVSSLDSTVLTINTYDISGAWQSRIDTAFTLNDSILNLNNLVDASQYPYIDLSAYYVDTNTFTPAQIDRWHVLYSPLPEAAIDGSTLYTWSATNNNTVTEGETIDFAVDVKNIFTVDMDSLLIDYWVEDENHNLYPITYARQDSLKVGETLRDTISFSTSGFVGVNSLWMEVNPYVNGSLFVTDQPEQEHFNNLLQVPFFVTGDSINPILDVTFNGNHILNGDIVDPNSEILITLKDDNEFLIMDDVSDTTLFGVYITDPQGALHKIPFVDNQGTTVMQWIPATSQNRRFKIIWPAEFELDGEYKLLVQGADRSGNISGDIEYRVNFEIIHESTITKMMNYPNPFSTSTRFVFTLTGSEAPDDIIIQIMTVSGRVVREITEDQLGIIQIGRNITDYAWDGTDEFGDPLANGVYLYRVKARLNGEDIKHRDSGADPYFTKDFGKMYILR
jgi:hypothetical protein